MKVLVIGSAALDTVKTPHGEAKGVLGGSAIYFSVAASFFTKVCLVAVVGKDFPAKHIEFLRKRGIYTEGLTVEDGETFRWEGNYEKDLNTAMTIDTKLNVFSAFHPEIPAEYAGCKYVFLANIDPDLQLEVLKQVSNPGFIACDTMNHWIADKPEALKKTIKHVDLFVLNDAEAKQLTKTANIMKSAEKLLKMGPRVIVIKRGEFGAVMVGRNFLFAIPAFPLDKVVDPTGAGDTFAGGMMGYIAKTADTSKEGLKKAAAYGTVMASFNVQDFSMERMKRLKKEEIDKRFLELRRLVRF